MLDTGKGSNEDLVKETVPKGEGTEFKEDVLLVKEEIKEIEEDEEGEESHQE
jgi:hypothetical protein